MWNTLLIILPFGIAMGLLIANKRGLLRDTALGRLDKIASVISAVCGIVGLIMVVWQPVESRFLQEIVVRDATTGEPIPQAKVTLEIGEDYIYRARTNSQGRANLSIPTKHTLHMGLLLVDAAGYELFEHPSTIRKDILLETVELVHAQRGIVQPFASEASDRQDSSPNSNDPSSVEVARDELRPVDVVVIMDNSCSMFPKDTAGCGSAQQYGSDPKNMRIQGAQAFLSRLGFGAHNQMEYRAGAIVFGDKIEVLYHLLPLSENRDAIVRSLSNQRAQSATRVVPALQMAYQELELAPPRPNNRAALLLVSDGVPWPTEGQSEIDLEAAIKGHPNTLLYMILLQSPSEMTSEFVIYRQFWKNAANKYPNVLIYDIQNDLELAYAFGDVAARLQNVIASWETIELSPQVKYPVFVNRYVERITFTVIHSNRSGPGNLMITDPAGQQVRFDESGVQHHSSNDGIVEIISISEPRLRLDQRDVPWHMEADGAVRVLTDRKGGYRIKLLEPEYSLTGTKDTYLAIQRHDRRRSLRVRFQLEDDQGKIIRESQPIRGMFLGTGGHDVPLRIPANLQPDADGRYEISLNLAEDDFRLPPTYSRISLAISAGYSGEQSGRVIPVATLRLHLDIIPDSISLGRRILVELLEFGEFIESITLPKIDLGWYGEFLNSYVNLISLAFACCPPLPLGILAVVVLVVISRFHKASVRKRASGDKQTPPIRTGSTDKQSSALEKIGQPSSTDFEI